MPWRLQPGDYDAALCHARLLSWCLSLRRIEGREARTSATVRARAAAGQPLGGRRHLDGARPRQHAGQPSRSGRTRRVRRLAWQTLRRRGRDHRGRRRSIEAYPTVAAVGRGSARPPHVAILRWSGSTRARPCAADLAVRQGRLFRYRRIRHQAVERHAADEEGHGRRRHRARPWPE